LRCCWSIRIRVCLMAAYDFSIHSCTTCKLCALVEEMLSLALTPIPLSFALLTLYIPGGLVVLLILLMKNKKKLCRLNSCLCLLKMTLKQKLCNVVLHLNLLSELPQQEKVQMKYANEWHLFLQLSKNEYLCFFPYQQG